MAITTKKPPMKETVGAQYVCFDQNTTAGEFSGTYETNVEKTETVKKVTVSEQSETTPAYASGKLYDSDTQTESAEVDVEVIAFSDSTVHKMRGDTVDESGLIFSGNGTRPFFAYGKVVELKGGKKRLQWFPKCKLSENTDEAETSEGKSSEMTDTLKIVAYPFNDAGNICTMVDNVESAFPEGLTEDVFFSKPILTPADLAGVLATVNAPANQNG